MGTGGEAIMTASGAGEVLLEARGVSKFFPGVRALDKVDLTLRAGQVHALVGENGAGKSTLMKIMAGLHQPDEGELRLRGERVVLPNPLSAQRAGISVIHQEFHLMPHLSAAQNMFIGREPKLPGGFLNDDRELNRMAGEVLERLGVHIDPRVRVADLTVASQQLLEIAKALTFNASVLVMDEPTAALVDVEVDTLFRIIDEFVTPESAVIYISHRMEEIRRIATRVTVLRDGALVDSRPADELSIREIIQLMVGRELDADARPAPRAATQPVLEVRGLSTTDLLMDVSFTLNKGEILGFAGLMGAGRTETARALIGADPRTAGTVTLHGRQVDIRNPRDAVELGIGYLSEDRKRYGLILGQDVAANIALASIPKFTRAGILQEEPMRRAAAGWVERLAVKTPSVRERLRNLSGGNQQKVVLAKWLERDCDVLVFDEPTRGIDVGAKQEIYNLLDRLTDEGKSIIMISSELEEILRMSDRIAVMCNGQITGFLTNAEATQENIMELATRFHQSDDDAPEELP
ncbi:sugar ABC transporter ATP-binding protein [Tessaracoccus sp. OS52]|uniref:sugar ABC transporter ATP-binding protein n=1 Tax=Tessaracoccus sp. OS52 TaxID=2886691 RepID=UPI001D12442A|nr:sugar ABC transporter ATP-binding protein [Tessaracoccus sp. OS52]MCC2594695.1 sugar ABC transporter ATP-binding protein [Tessaracoccus sp. OS52]